MEDPKKTIDVKKILRENGPGFMQLFFSIISPIVSRILHEREINEFLYQNKSVYGVDLADAVLDRMGISYTVAGDVPKGGRYIFAANHPLGGVDSNIFMSAVGKVHQEIKFIVNDVLMVLQNYGGVFVPVNVFGSEQKRGGLVRIKETLESNAQILVYPAGEVSRKLNGVPTDGEWAPTFVNWAKKYERDVVPGYISGANSKLFYSLGNLRRKLGIGLNLEMFLLAHEMFNQKEKSLEIAFGTPIQHTSLSRENSQREWAERIRNQTYRLKFKTRHSASLK